MSGLLVAILVICAVMFVLSWIGLLGSDHGHTNTTAGVVVTLILWKPVLALGIITLIFTVLGAIISAIKVADL